MAQFLLPPENHKAQDPKASGQAFSWEGLPPRLAQKALAIKALLEARRAASPPGEHREAGQVQEEAEVQKLEPQKEPEAQVALARRAQHREAEVKLKKSPWPVVGQGQGGSPTSSIPRAMGKEEDPMAEFFAPLNNEAQDHEAQEWPALLAQAEARIRRFGHWEKLGPLAPLVRLFLALALQFGARKDPSREATVFLAQWELAAMLGVSSRTVERWLNDPRYERYRRVARRWIAWRVWRTDGQAIGVQGAVKGGTVWRVKVKPKGRPFRVLAPQLRWVWRDLGEDVRRGATERGARARGLVPVSGYKLTGVTLRVVPGKIPLATLVLKPVNYYPDTPSTALPYELYDLLQAEADLQEALARPGERVRWVQGIASKIAAALKDGKSLRFWYRILWAALRKGEAARRVLFRVVQVAKEATGDGFARKPGAYAQWLLRREWAAIG